MVYIVFSEHITILYFLIWRKSNITKKYYINYIYITKLNMYKTVYKLIKC